VFPFTEKGRVESPLSIMAGASIPPIAPLVEVAVALVLAEEAEVAVAFEEVEFENGAETTAAFVASGASTVTVPVTIEHADSEAEALATSAGAVVCAFAPDEATAPCVCTAATLPALAETESVVSEMTVPVTVAVTGTVTVAVTV
jgi:hypothetical protein